jgi:hypothetical protein
MVKLVIKKKDKVPAVVSPSAMLLNVDDSEPEMPSGFGFASNIHPGNVDWLWKGYIPKGALIMIDALPGEGKSTITCDIAARVSSGIPFLGGEKLGPRVVVMINGEDYPPQVTIPRILAAGGDLGKIIIWPTPGSTSSPPRLPDQIYGLEEIVAAHDVGLITIDPLHSHLGTKVKVENDQHMKAALQPLTKLAQAKAISILAVRHTTKAKTGLAVTAGLGSIGTIATARVGYIVGPDPNGSGDKIFACSKTNIGPMPPSLKFKIVDAIVDSADGESISTSKIEWLGTTTLTANELCKPNNAGDGSALNEAIDFLEEILAEGPMSSEEVKAEAKEADISPATLNRAKKVIGIKPKKTASHWEWKLPGQEM